MATRAEMNEARDRIVLTWDFSSQNLAKTKSIPGRKFVPADKGGPYWTVPLDMVSARKVRELWVGEIEWGPNLLAWGRETRKAQDGLKELAHAVDHPLDELRLAEVNPELAQWLRPYQRADVAFLSRANAINANEQGLGKTAEIIAAIQEAGLEDSGPHLVSAPVTSLEVVWKTELERWSKLPVLAAEDLSQREQLIAEAARLHDAGEPFWLCINPGMIRYESIMGWDAFKQKNVEVGVNERYPELFRIKWSTVTIDEFQKMGLNNPKTLASRALYGLTAARRYALSGTPMGGVPLKLYGVLKFVEPKEYSSKWRWAEQWLVVEEKQVGRFKTAKEIGGIKPGLEDEFYSAHSRHMVRHLKSEVLPQLPPKQYVDVWCKMTANQAKQYKQFAAEAEVRIDDEQLTATGVLAEYARLKSFAAAYCEIESKTRVCRCGSDPNCPKCQGLGEVVVQKLKPTFDSGKLPYLMDKLAESGIDPKQPAGEAVAVIGSQSVEVCEMVHRYLNEQGVHAEILTGKTIKPGERTRLVKGFQNGDYRVLVISTLAGGVSITLDRADTVHILDETWVPDDQEQLEDRIHRASRIHQVTCFYYRTRNTIEEYIKQVNDDKAFTNENILDLRRNGLRAVKEKGAK
jgi:SNF2 family DNA or RNA helicase